MTTELAGSELSQSPNAWPTSAEQLAAMVAGGVVVGAFVVFVVVTAVLAFSVDVRFEKLFRSARCGRAIARPVFESPLCEVLWGPFAPTGPIPTVTASDPTASAPINAKKLCRLFMPSLVHCNAGDTRHRRSRCAAS